MTKRVAIGINFDEDGNIQSTEAFTLPDEWNMAAVYRFTSMIDADTATVTELRDLPWWAQS